MFDDTINDTINLRGKKMENRESETVEFKKSTSELKQGIISLSSMLNKSGSGVLYFGVLNDSTVMGQQIGKDTTHDISVEGLASEGGVNFPKGKKPEKLL